MQMPPDNLPSQGGDTRLYADSGAQLVDVEQEVELVDKPTVEHVEPSANSIEKPLVEQEVNNAAAVMEEDSAKPSYARQMAACFENSPLPVPEEMEAEGIHNHGNATMGEPQPAAQSQAPMKRPASQVLTPMKRPASQVLKRPAAKETMTEQFKIKKAKMQEERLQAKIKNGCSKCRGQKFGCGQCRVWAREKRRGYHFGENDEVLCSKGS
jgi:hypothetical protein